MKKSAYRLIRFGTPILCLLLLLPSFCLWAVAETQSTENGMSSQALESAEASTGEDGSVPLHRAFL